MRLDGRLAIVVVPATSRVDLDKLRRATGAANVRLAEEAEFREEFDACQVGTVPPFGNLFGTETFVDHQLAREEHIAFNAGTHTDVFVVRFPDFVRLVQPRLIDVAAETTVRQVNQTSKRRGGRRTSEVLPTDLWNGEASFQTECGWSIVPNGAD
jgi:Aminoacyl-tRNA editing domain